MENMNRTAVPLMPQAVAHHMAICRWGKSLSKTGFVLVGLFILGGISAGLWAESICYFYRIAGVENSAHGHSPAFPAFISVAYLILAAIYFFPVLALYRHSRQTDHAVRHDHSSFREERSGALKANLVMTGILLVVAIVLLIAGAVLLLCGPPAP